MLLYQMKLQDHKMPQLQWKYIFSHNHFDQVHPESTNLISLTQNLSVPQKYSLNTILQLMKSTHMLE